MGSHGSRAWWVVKESTLPTVDFNSTLFDNNGSQYEQFGRIVAVDGNLVAVGVRNDNSNSMYRKVYVYEVSDADGSLSLKFVVQPDDPNSDGSLHFGSSLALENGRLIVGAHRARNVSGDWSEVGAAYLFDVNGSSPQQLARITASDGTDDDYLGGGSTQAVAISGNIIVAGANLDDPNGYQNAGSAYVFRRESNGTITELAKLTAPDGRADDHFGIAAAVDANHIAIGAYYAHAERDGSTQSQSGKVYLYKLGQDGNVSYVETLTAPYVESGAQFGWSLSISDGFLAVGQHRSSMDLNGNNYLYTQGSVCLYQLYDAQPARLASFISPRFRCLMVTLDILLISRAIDWWSGLAEKMQRDRRIRGRPISSTLHRMESQPWWSAFPIQRVKRMINLEIQLGCRAKTSWWERHLLTSPMSDGMPGM